MERGFDVRLLVCLAIFIWTGIRGADFGLHWDEAALQIGPVKKMVETETLLPKNYTYPSFDYWLNLGLAAPEFLKAARDSKDISPLPEQPGVNLTRVRGENPGGS